MLGSELYNLATALLGDNAPDIDVFYQMVNMQKNMREMSRDWMKLRAVDTSAVFTSADAYTSTKPLPLRFLRTYSFYDQYGHMAGPYIITSAGQKLSLKPIKLAEAYDYRNIEGYYYLDIKNNAIGRTGTTEGILHLPFLQGTIDIDSSIAWGLPPSDFYGAILAYDVAVEINGSVDWDRINQQKIPYNQRKIQQLESNLATWDARLQQAELGV